jgi:nucleoside permease NupC
MTHQKKKTNKKQSDHMHRHAKECKTRVLSFLFSSIVEIKGQYLLFYCYGMSHIIFVSSIVYIVFYQKILPGVTDTS